MIESILPPKMNEYKLEDGSERVRRKGMFKSAMNMLLKSKVKLSLIFSTTKEFRLLNIIVL